MAAQNDGRHVSAVYHQHPVAMPGVEVFQADLTKPEDARRILNECKPDWIVHCAALVNLDECEVRSNEAERFNVVMPGLLAEAAAQCGARMVYISTDSVFEGTRGFYTEEDYPKPVNEYAKSKLAGERIVQKHLPRALILRTNMFGWNARDKKSLSEWMLDNFESGRAFPGFNDVYFNPLLVNDLSLVVLELIGWNAEGLFHLGASDACSKYEFALKIAEVFGLDKSLVKPVSIKDSTLKVTRPLNTSLAIAKAAGVLKRPMPTLNVQIERFKALRDSGYVGKLKELSGGVAHAKD